MIGQYYNFCNLQMNFYQGILSGVFWGGDKQLQATDTGLQDLL
jgi:hypothetical protein